MTKPVNIPMSHTLGEITGADGRELPIRVQKATIVADYSDGGPVTARLEGVLQGEDGNYILDADAEMVVKARDGRKYRLVEVEA